MIFKKLLNLGKRKESKSESSRFLKDGFGIAKAKSGTVYVRDDDLFFVGGAELGGEKKHRGRLTAWYPFFKLPKAVTDREKGKAIQRILKEFVVGLPPNSRTGYVKEVELLRLSGQKNIASFYRSCGMCYFVLREGTKVVEMQPYRSTFYGTYDVNKEDKVQAPADDPEALGRALDECLDKAI